MKIYLMALILLGMGQAYGAAILIDETWGSSRNQTRSRVLGTGTALKAIKKMGVGTTLAGSTGLVGLNLEVNLTSDFSFSLGTGVSRGFRSFNINFKRTLGGESVLPYFVGGYSRWFSGGEEGGVDRTSPPVLGKKFLNAREKRTGEFAENIIYPGLGVQFLNRAGDWQGLAFFAEVLLLVDTDDFVTGGTGGIGTIYYF